MFEKGNTPPNKGKGRAIQWLREHVNHQGDECLVWPFGRARGYGQFGLNGKVLRAHRVMCELAHGPAPSQTHQAAHSCGCGHAGCVNPRHLSWKSQGDNQKDRRRHGTKNMGLGKYGRKLTPDEIAAIRILQPVKTQDELAKMFDTSRRNIGAILSGRTWSRPAPQAHIFTKEEIAVIKFSTESGVSLARKYGVSDSTISRIRRDLYVPPILPAASRR